MGKETDKRQSKKYKIVYCQLYKLYSSDPFAIASSVK